MLSVKQSVLTYWLFRGSKALAFFFLILSILIYLVNVFFAILQEYYYLNYS